MEFIQSSKDILFLVIAGCVLFFTIFLVWFIYYLAMIMRQVYIVIKEMRERIEKLNKVIRDFKEKIEHGASYLALISEGVKKITEVVRDRGKKSKSKEK